MLKTLKVSNIVLIDHAEISFEKGFNVLTGETGSGKSAILGAMSLISGTRADTNLLRRGAAKGLIEAAFEINGHQDLLNLLQTAGIDHDPEEDLILRREVSETGKSRAFVNNQFAQLALLKKIGEHLLEFVGQHANQRLTSLEEQRAILDLYGGSKELSLEFQRNFQTEQILIREVERIKTTESERLRRIEACQRELEELEEAALREGEEEELFSEYSRLTHSVELAKCSREISEVLLEGEKPVLPQLLRLKANFDELIAHDPSLKETAALFLSAVIELEETANSISHYGETIEYHPQRVEELNLRITFLNKLKRKYGPTVEDVLAYERETKQRLLELEKEDSKIEELEAEIKKIHAHTDQLARTLSGMRIEAATALEKAMLHQLQALNMPKALFFIEMTPIVRSLHGDEAIEFFFTPNVGEKRISIRECASGGELSRIMLALQALLAGKEQTPTIIFDEIDANIGGETAAVVGLKLSEIGNGHQVLCITHFPQVAKCAAHHLHISKQEREGRTYTEIVPLGRKERSQELSRMSGK